MQQQHTHPDDLIFIQSRAEVNIAVIEEYKEMMEDGVEFDPVQAVEDDEGGLFVWDGSHRGEAARQLNRFLLVETRKGTRADAEWLALSANQKHGLRRSRADKQYIVRQALLLPNGPTRSNRDIARHCGVDHKTVGRIRQELEEAGEIDKITERTVTKEDGTQYQIETGSNEEQSPPERPGEDDFNEEEAGEEEFGERPEEEEDGGPASPSNGNAPNGSTAFQQATPVAPPLQSQEGQAQPKERALKFAQVNQGGVAMEITIYIDGEAHNLPVTAMYAEGPISGLPEMSLDDQQTAALVLPAEKAKEMNLLYLTNMAE